MKCEIRMMFVLANCSIFSSSKVKIYPFLLIFTIHALQKQWCQHEIAVHCQQNAQFLKYTVLLVWYRWIWHGRFSVLTSVSWIIKMFLFSFFFQTYENSYHIYLLPSPKYFPVYGHLVKFFRVFNVGRVQWCMPGLLLFVLFLYRNSFFQIRVDRD